MDDQKKAAAKENRKFYYIVGIGGQITILLVGPVVFCLFLGFWLDSIFHASPFFIILGVVIGFIGSVFNIFRVMEIINKL
jgi:F0F1-type ATP synthase assembly protein I